MACKLMTVSSDVTFSISKRELSRRLRLVLHPAFRRLSNRKTTETSRRFVEKRTDRCCLVYPRGVSIEHTRAAKIHDLRKEIF